MSQVKHNRFSPSPLGSRPFNTKGKKPLHKLRSDHYSFLTKSRAGAQSPKHGCQPADRSMFQDIREQDNDLLATSLTIQPQASKISPINHQKQINRTKLRTDLKKMTTKKITPQPQKKNQPLTPPLPLTTPAPSLYPSTTITPSEVSQHPKIPPNFSKKVKRPQRMFSGDFNSAMIPELPKVSVKHKATISPGFQKARVLKNSKDSDKFAITELNKS